MFLSLANLIMTCLSVGLFVYNLFGILWAFRTCLFLSPDQGSFWSLFLQIGSWSLALSFLLLVFPWCRCCYISCCSKCFLKLSSFLEILFLFAALPRHFFFTLSSKSLIWSSVSSNLLFISSSVLFISDIAFFIFYWSFKNVFYVFFHVVEYLIIITLNSDKLLALILSSSSGEFSCSFIWGLFLYLPILAASLYLFPCIR